MEALGMLKVALEDVLVGFELGVFPGSGPPISRALLTPLGSNLVTFAFTMLTA
jgi:TctA family transporter